jgi:hypothetical protein
VDSGPDAADDWIAEHVKPRDIVITNDIPLADRALKAGASALGATGKAFTTASIGAALARRELMEHLRSFGEGQGGPKPFSAADRSRFLSALDAAVAKAKAKRGDGRFSPRSVAGSYIKRRFRNARISEAVSSNHSPFKRRSRNRLCQ